jgi:hypothetical protein
MGLILCLGSSDALPSPFVSAVVRCLFSAGMIVELLPCPFAAEQSEFQSS